MIEYRFHLNDIEAEEPMGWSEVVLGVLRDEEYHGLTFSATISELGFYGAASDYLAEQKELYGLQAKVQFLAEQKCDPNGQWEEVLSGRMNFGRYRKTCGDECLVFMPIENQSCALTLRNRIDQKVDIDSNVAFDKFTPLQEYPGLNFTTTLPPVAIVSENLGESSAPITTNLADDPDWGINETSNIMRQYVSIPVGNITASSFGNFIMDPLPTFYGFSDGLSPATNFPPTVNTSVLLNTIKCDIPEVEFKFRIKGNIDAVRSGSTGTTVGLNLRFFKLKAGEEYIATNPDWEVLHQSSLAILTNTQAKDFDTGDLVFTLNDVKQGDIFVLAYYLVVTPPTALSSLTLRQDPETFFRASANILCEESDAEVSLVNETMARVVESATNNCMTFKSDYYGRTDSAPYASQNDGCGGLRVLTNGLKIRQADVNNFFFSFQDGFNGLRAIDNIGWGIEPNPNIPGSDWVRMEPVEYFYQDIEIMELPFVPRAVINVDESKYYSVIKVGYQKWEVQEINGLKEPNANREFRTSLETINNTLDIESALVAGSYAIEVTRQQSFAETGAADTTYDNDTFIICMTRNVYGLEVEQGGIENPTNLFSPDTLLNYRLTPLRNLMRWFKSIINSYANITDSTAKLFFSSGTGNYTASGLILGDCADELTAIAENKDLWHADFKNAQDYLPLTKPETVTVDRYPMSLAEYKKVRSQPYGYVSVQCGTGDNWVKGYILELNYQITKGEASMKLRLKWEA